MRSSSCALVALLLCLTAPVAQAQMGMMGHDVPGQRMFTFGIGGGLSVPVSDAKDALKNGFNGEAYVRFQPPALPVGFGVNFTFQRFDLKDAAIQSAGVSAGGSGTGQMIGGLAHVKYDLLRGPIRPYIAAGLGAYNFNSDVSGAPGGSVSTTKFGINGTVGVSVRIAAVSAFVQGRIDNVYSDRGAIDVKTIQVVPVTLGVEF